jgi:Ca-activated chloride channel family protein
VESLVDGVNSFLLNYRKRENMYKLALLFFMFFFCSCSGIRGKLLVMEGNFYNSRGLSNKAIAAYMKASSFHEAKGYAEFGLGSSYYSLGESDVALERFKDAELTASGDTELLYRIYYNQGIVRFEKGFFDEAVADFKRALNIEPSRIGAKRNLELSLLSQEHQKIDRQKSSEKEAGKNAENSERVQTLFKFLKEKEIERWKSSEWIENAPMSGPDY